MDEAREKTRIWARKDDVGSSDVDRVMDTSCSLAVFLVLRVHLQFRLALPIQQRR